MVITSKRQETQAKVLTTLRGLHMVHGVAHKYSAKELVTAHHNLPATAAALQLLESKGLVQRTVHVPTQWSLTQAGLTVEVR